MKKLFAILSLVLVAAMLLTACGGGGAKISDDNPQASRGDAYKGMGDGKTLIYWAMWNETETQAEVYKHTIEHFEADTGYKVDVQWLGRDVTKLFPAAIDAGEVIDVMDGYSDLKHIDYAVDIDEYATKFGMKDTTLKAFQLYVEQYSDDGHWYGVASQPFVGAVFYNKAIFREAGIETLPTTWDEFLDCCEKIKAIGKIPMTIDDAYVGLLSTHQLGLALGIEGVNELWTSFGDAWSDPTVVDVLTKWQEFYEAGNFHETVGGNQFPAAQNGQFAIGDVAMYMNATWLPNEVASITGDDFEWGMMYMPSMTGGDYEVPMLGCQIMSVSKTTTDVEGSTLLLKYLNDAETCQELADVAQCVPVVGGVEWPKNLADAEAMAASATNTFVWCVHTESNDDVSTLADTYFHQLIGGLCTAEEMIDHMVSGS